MRRAWPANLAAVDATLVPARGGPGVAAVHTHPLWEALPMMTKIIALIGATLVAFALFGLTFSAIVAEDGALRATAFGVIFGLTGFSLTFVTVQAILDTGK